jgi:hypothetical protein
VNPARIRVGFPSTLHPLAVHPDGSGAAAGEVVAAAEDEEEEEEEEEEEAEMEVEADVADDEAEDAEDLDADTDAELDEADGATAPAGPVKIVNREPPPQVCPAFPAQGVLH